MYSGNTPIPSHYSESKLTLNHQGFLFTTGSITLSCRILGNESFGYYQLTTGISCDANSNSSLLINNTRANRVVWKREDLLDEGNSSLHLKFTFFDHNGSDLSLETFQLKPGSELITLLPIFNYIVLSFLITVITEDFIICNSSMPLPNCIQTPPLNGRQTLILAVPSLSASSQSRQDILCPVHPHLNERCVDLLSCNNFNETVFTNSISICKTVDFDTSLELEMCFHNVTEAMNGTKLHLFYSKLQFACSVGRLWSSRTYVKSIRLILDEETDSEG